MTSSYTSILFALLCANSSTNAFVIQNKATAIYPGESQLSMMQSEDGEVSTRVMFTKTAASFASIASIVGGNPEFAFAAKSGPTPDELNRIKVGYERMSYLLENFDKETTVCRENGGECKRDADPVRKYMGLRSTTDPLFQIEKVFDKIKFMDIDPDNLEGIFEATEEWNTAVTLSNSMAFISQFGEYNPGGGKDEVLKYLEESKKQVVLAKTALEKIMKGLELL